MDLTVITLLPVLFSGVISGMILFHAGIIAPTLFKTVSSKEAGPFLRLVFPKLFLFVLILGIFSLLVLFLGNGAGVAKISSTITVVSMIVCYSIIPATNSARDLGEENTFKRLHRLSVVLTMVVLLVNLIWMFLL